jgi:hypothetical protein
MCRKHHVDNKCENSCCDKKTYTLIHPKICQFFRENVFFIPHQGNNSEVKDETAGFLYSFCSHISREFKISANWTSNIMIKISTIFQAYTENLVLQRFPQSQEIFTASGHTIFLIQKYDMTKLPLARYLYAFKKVSI